MNRLFAKAFSKFSTTNKPTSIISNNFFISNNIIQQQLKSFSILNLKLNNIKDNENANKKKICRGRGPGCGKGKTSGRGHKGSQRSYKIPIYSQGGQSSITRIFPKFGRTYDRSKLYSELNIHKLHDLIRLKRIDPKKPITLRTLTHAGAVSSLKNGIKLLGKGLEKLENLPPINITVTNASESVIKKINECGGKITCRYQGLRGMKFECKPYKFIRAINDTMPNNRILNQYLELEKKGAKIAFVKPVWYRNGEYTKMMKKIEKLKKLLDEQPDKHILPEYPPNRSPGCGKDKLKIRNPQLGRKVVYEKSMKN